MERRAEILVTGAAGKTGLAVIRALAQAGHGVRALVFRVEQRQAALSAGATEALVGDTRDPHALVHAVGRMRAVYHIAPNVSPDEIVMGETVISAAKSAGLDRFVYHSVLHPQIEAMPHHWQKMRVEERLLHSGIAFTILQPAAYMQNILAGWQTILASGQFTVPYPVTTRLSLVDLRDVAQVAARVLTEDGHEGASYELVGTIPLNQDVVAETLSRVLEKPVVAVEVGLEAWAEKARSAGMSDYALDTLLRMFRCYAEYGFSGNPRILRHLLGREPGSLEDFLRSVKK